MFFQCKNSRINTKRAQCLCNWEILSRPVVQLKIIPLTVISKEMWDLDDKHFSYNCTGIGEMTQTNIVVFRFFFHFGHITCLFTVPGTLSLLATKTIIACSADGEGTRSNLSQKTFSYTATLSPLMCGERDAHCPPCKRANSERDNGGKPPIATRVVALVSTFNPHVRTQREGWPF